MNEEKNKVNKGTLYLVATPIGNLSDISERALKVLSECDFIAAEDTRNSAKLLSCYGIRKELISYFEHNKKSRGEIILNRIQNGESCALITDAGMPGISDPGEDMVRLCAEASVPVSIIPGACAAVSALVLSGLSTGRFVFEGFLPAVKGDRRQRLQEIAHENRTLILYEAPHRLKQTLLDLERTFGDRRISLCRELTKINEEIQRMTISSAIAYYEEHDPRGEYVLILEGEREATGKNYTLPVENELLNLSPKDHVEHYEMEGMKHMDAIKAAAKDRNMSKSDFYDLLISQNS